MEVPLQPRKGGGAGAAKGRGNVSIITPHRGSRRRVE
jgi:preprotein translocase subunit SecG